MKRSIISPTVPELGCVLRGCFSGKSFEYPDKVGLVGEAMFVSNLRKTVVIAFQAVECHVKADDTFELAGGYAYML